ncbi:MAG: hypothetical protein CMF46_05265 [Legionellales bacterium]|nr:hypothetical protein [Legionellales bacterium]
MRNLKDYSPVFLLMVVLAITMALLNLIWHWLVVESIDDIVFNTLLTQDEYDFIANALEQQPKWFGPNDLAAVAEYFDAMPWLSVQQVTYDNPGHVRVLLNRVPMVGYWGPSHVIDAMGMIFDSSDVPADHLVALPMIAVSGKRSPEEMIRVIECLRLSGFVFHEIQSLGSDSLLLQLDGLPRVRILCQDGCAQVAKIHKAIGLLRERRESFSEIDYIDMRYKNAFSIKKFVS